ncbi:hypothetical protein M9H77_27282 [Catharanthus roseus]|uniref:Uncharacterized protein n=1 Tax=Catharanthus roseus TaxID=4058 RepID=A0ACC0ACX8_CATRO|nr:hypothetical protein M9H77_27282 [Catharanthus roseus]
MSLITDEIRKSASELYHGHEICSEKSKFLLKEVGLPNGLLPLDDMVECGYVKDTGFVWLISKKKTEYKFKKINKLVQYATEVTAYVEPNKIKKLTGVKAKELLMWITLSDIYVDVPSTGNIHFKTPAGLSRTFPIDAFLVEEKPSTTAAAGGDDVPAAEDETVVAKKAPEEINVVKEATSVEVKEV